MARGKRPDTFRTRKLSLSAPMVLPRGRGGRVGRRRTTIPEGAPAFVLGPLSAFLGRAFFTGSPTPTGDDRCRDGGLRGRQQRRHTPQLACVIRRRRPEV